MGIGEHLDLTVRFEIKLLTNHSNFHYRISFAYDNENLLVYYENTIVLWKLIIIDNKSHIHAHIMCQRHSFFYQDFSSNLNYLVIFPAVIKRYVVLFYLDSNFFYHTKKKLRLSRNRMAFVLIFKMTPNALIFCRRQFFLPPISTSDEIIRPLATVPMDVQFQAGYRQKWNSFANRHFTVTV